MLDQLVGKDVNPGTSEYDNEMQPTPQQCSVQAFHM
jgi:hypothetical protein